MLICSIPDCVEPVGIKSNRIPDGQITATNYYPGWEPYKARLNHNTAWSCHNLDQNQYIQVVLNQQQYITGVKTQGKNDAWVTRYTVEYNDGSIWTFVTDIQSQVAKVFSKQFR